ncbi:MAG TPA: hypothetical protein PKM78_00495 [Anaerolineae bacterium]|nr:hypothetical protein [Anaerolineae bacterium]HNU03747.1 hypothetical protein [Anaerolineae bacterium]
MSLKILSKLYEPGSLRNTDSGFELAFKNTFAPTQVTAVGPLVIDGGTIDLGQAILRLERPSERLGRPPSVREWQFKALNKDTEKDKDKDRTLSFDLFTVARIVVPGQRLSPGPHQVALSMMTKEVGEIKLTAEDSVAEQGSEPEEVQLLPRS